MAPKNRKEPENMVGSVTGDSRQELVTYHMTGSVDVCQWLGRQVVAGGGAPPGYGMGRFMGFLTPDFEFPQQSKDKSETTGVENVEAMSEIVKFKGAADIAVCAFQKCIEFSVFDRENLTRRCVARYTLLYDPQYPESKRGDRLVALSPSGRVCVVTADHNELHVVALVDDADSNTALRARAVARFPGHTDDITSLAIAPLRPPAGVQFDGSKPTPLLVASVSDDKTLRLWRTADVPLQNTSSCEGLHQMSAPAGVIELQQPHQVKKRKHFRLQAVRFSNQGSELHVVMSHGDGPSFLVSYLISWQKSQGKKWALRCSTLPWVMIDRNDAVTTLEFTSCGRFIAFGTAEGGDVVVATRDGDVLARKKNRHDVVKRISVVTLSADQLAVASAGTLNDVSVQKIRVLLGMTPLDVLYVAGLLFFFAAVGLGAFLYTSDAETVACLVSKFYKTQGADADPAVLAYLSPDNRANKEIPMVLSRLMSQRELHGASFSDPVLLAQLVGPPVVGLLLSLLACLSEIDVIQYSWVSFAAGGHLGFALLHQLPLSHTDRNHLPVLLAFFFFFVVDSMLRSPPPDPSLAGNTHVLERKDGERFGLLLKDDNVIANVDAGTAAARAGLRTGMRLVAIDDKPLQEGKGKEMMVMLPDTGRFTLQTTMAEVAAAAVPLGDAWRVASLSDALHYLVLAIFLACKTTQHAYLYAAHAFFIEIGGVGIIMSCGVSPERTLLLRLGTLAGALLLPSLVMSHQLAELIAPWVLPLSCAGHLYVAVVHLMPALLQAERIGVAGALMQFMMIFSAITIHTLIGH